MRFFRWIIISAAVVVGLAVVAIAIGALWLNTFIHSTAFKTEVETRASQSVGAPVQIESINFDVFHGLKLQGLVTQIDPSHSGGQGALKIQVASVNCTCSLSELLNRRLRLTGVTLDQPQIVLTKQAAAPMTATDNGSGPGTSVTPAGAEAAGQGTADPFQFVLDKAKINEGSVSVRDANGVSMVELQGINAAANTSGYYESKDVTGTLRMADVAASNLHLTHFSTPFTYHPNFLDAGPFAATAFGGNIAGGYHLDGTGPSALDFNAKGVDVAQFTAAINSSSSTKLSGSLDVQSKWHGVETGDLNGEGDAQLTKGKLDGVKILHQLSQLLRVKELDAPVITQAKTHFVVQNRQTKFIGLQMDSIGFQMTGSGIIGFDGSLNADMVLILSSDAMSKLPKAASAFFVPQPDGSATIAYHLSGTVANPQTDLATHLFMQNIKVQNAINKALNKFFK